jgi:hypothetical protein
MVTQNQVILIAAIFAASMLALAPVLNTIDLLPKAFADEIKKCSDKNTDPVCEEDKTKSKPYKP